MAPTVTALTVKPNGRVGVALDGEQWRVLPADAVVRAGLREGVTLDRGRARTLARELRRADALAEAGRAIRHRDLSARRLAERLDRRRIAPKARDEALETLTRTQLVDDERFARSRARSLAERNLGDAAIRYDLERHGIAPELIEEACAELSPELERAERVVARRGSSPATARFLAQHGFDEDVVERVFARGQQAELG